MDILKSHQIVKARKTHICNFCGKEILKGEKYTASTYVEDYIYSWKTCNRCKEYVDEAFSNKEYDFSDGMGESEFHDYMWENHREVAAEWWK